ncbi:ankyrin repeat domain-containing protein [Paenibacillus tarimensis]
MNLTEQIANIFKAAQNGDAVRISEIISKNPELANAENNDGLTPLGFASHFGQKDAVLALLDYGADINALSHSKVSFIPSNTALHAAIAGNNIDVVNVVEVLIQKGAEINAVDSNGHTPIQAAAFEGNLEIAQLLIDNGADISRKSGLGSAVSIASKRGHNEFAELLLVQ